MASIGLAIPALFLIASALWSFMRADRMANSARTLQIIEANEELDGHYIPDNALLSDKGLALRRRGRRTMLIAAALMVAALILSQVQA